MSKKIEWDKETETYWKRKELEVKNDTFDIELDSRADDRVLYVLLLVAVVAIIGVMGGVLAVGLGVTLVKTVAPQVSQAWLGDEMLGWFLWVVGYLITSQCLLIVVYARIANLIGQYEYKD